MSICRIGVFYDGNYFTYAQRYYYHKRDIGWLNFQSFHQLLESMVREEESSSNVHKVVYAAWHQGIFTSSGATELQLKADRNRLHDLMHAGIEARFMPMGQSSVEKGVDVAMAVDAMQIALGGKIDVAVLVTGDADFVPLVRAMMKEGIRVAAAHFLYHDGDDRSFINERLQFACNYAFNISALEQDKKQGALFRGLFKKYEKGADANGA